MGTAKTKLGDELEAAATKKGDGADDVTLLSSEEGEGSSNDEDDSDSSPSSTAPPNAVQKEQKKPRGNLRPPRSLETTLFKRLEGMYGPGIKRMLNVQYRSVSSFQPRAQPLTEPQNAFPDCGIPFQNPLPE